MMKVLMITHKTYGKALIKIVSQKIISTEKMIHFIGFDENEGAEDLAKKISEIDLKDYSLCFVDLKGGTPANVCISSLWNHPDIPILMGVTPRMLQYTLECIVEGKAFTDDMIKSIKRIGVSSIQFNYL